MNTPAPAPPGGTLTAAPTLGSIIGSVLGTVMVGATGVHDPLLAGGIVTGITGLFTGLFHWLGSKIGQSSW